MRSSVVALSLRSVSLRTFVDPVSRLTLLVVLVLVGGCGGNDKVTTVAKSYPNLAALADAVGCKQLLGGSTPPPGATQIKTCVSKHWSPTDGVNLIWFGSNAARDDYILGGQNNGTSFARGDRWVVECPQSEQAALAAKLSGGTFERGL
jgi:hypothetical protein